MFTRMVRPTRPEVRSGDTIVAIDGRPVTKFGGMGDSISWRVVRSEGKTIGVDVLRDGKPLHFDVTPAIEEGKAWQRKGLRQILIEPAQAAIIAKIYSNSPAALAGLMVKDEIVSVNGRQPLHYAEVGEIMEKDGPQKVVLTVLRGEPALTWRSSPRCR